MKKKTPRISDQLRQLVRDSAYGQNDLGWMAGIDKAQMSRFMHGKGGLTIDKLDALAAVLEVRLTKIGPKGR